MTGKQKAIELLKEAKDDVVILNCIELLERSKIGVEKYGTTLSNANLNQKQLIQHALEESLDLINKKENVYPPSHEKSIFLCFAHIHRWA